MAMATPSTVALFVLSVVFTTCVLVMNVLSITAIVRTRFVRVSHSNMFILNLAIVDILMLGPQLYFGISAIRGLITPIGLIFNMACYFALLTAAMLNTFAIAVDRFLFIKQAMIYPSLVTSVRVKAVVLLIWILALFLGTICLYDMPFHQFSKGEIYKVYPACQNSTIRWLEETGFNTRSSNLSAYMQPIGICEEVEFTLFLHQMTSCPDAARPALRIQNILLFVLNCVLGAMSIVLYTQAFFVIRNHNKNLATHANFGHLSGDNCGKPGCKACAQCQDCRLKSCCLFIRSRRHSPRKGSTQDYRNRDESKSSTFRTSLSLGVLKNDSNKTLGREKSDTSLGQVATSSVDGSSSSNRLSQYSSSTMSSHFVSSNSRDGELKAGRDDHCDSAGSSNRTEDLSAQPNISRAPKSPERRSRLKFSIRHRFQDMRTLKTLGTMFAIYYICWIPMNICSFSLYGLLKPITEQCFLGAWILGTSNSVWNFLVYPMRNRELRTAITRLVCIKRQTRSKS